jgi:hypothetical protein
MLRSGIPACSLQDRFALASETAFLRFVISGRMG